MKFTKRQLKRIIREAIENPSTVLEQELSKDDAVDKIRDGEYMMYCDANNGEQELEYIIGRLRTIYDMGGAVGEIAIYDVGGSGGNMGLVKESGYDYSTKYPAMEYEVVFTIIDEMYGNPPDVIAAELASGIVDREQLEEALDEAMESPMNSRSQKIIEMALSYMGTSRFSRE